MTDTYTIKPLDELGAMKTTSSLIIQVKENNLFAWRDHKFTDSVGEALAKMAILKLEKPRLRYRLVRKTLEVLKDDES